jgi:hypothetical protein
MRTANKAIRCAALLLVLATSSGHPAWAQGGGGSLVLILADGKPWTLTLVPENRKATLTLHPDGTGAMEGGPMPMSPSWRATPDGLCLKPGMVMPERCVSLKREGAAIIGVRDGVVQLRLER